MRTIRRAAEIDRLFKEGRRVSHPALLVIAAPTADQSCDAGRVVVVAGKRLGSAVVRNRCKRVLREAARRAGAPWNGLDVALVARDGTGTAPPATLDRAIQRALESLGARSSCAE
jgi:ribonuclease P protein component